LNKSQCFTHGQFYVGASRVRRRENLMFLINELVGAVTNVVHPKLVADYKKDAEDQWSKYKDDCI
jgi:hypothetical protein